MLDRGNNGCLLKESNGTQQCGQIQSIKRSKLCIQLPLITERGRDTFAPKFTRRGQQKPRKLSL
jgi:hypothetical protein